MDAGNNPEHFSAILKKNFERLRDEFRKSCPNCHGRVPETAAWLEIGMMIFLSFSCDRLGLKRSEYDKRMEKFRTILLHLAAQQADNITEDTPTHKYIRNLLALLQSGQVCTLPRNTKDSFVPMNCVGYEDDNYFYLLNDVAHKMVRKFCDEKGEVFTISPKALLKQLAEEGFLSSGGKQNTKSVRFNGESKRVACLIKDKAEQLYDSSL